MFIKKFTLTLGASLLAISGFLVACGNDDNDSDKQDAQQAVQAWLDSGKDGDVDASLVPLTDKGLAEFAFFASPAMLDEVKAEVPDVLAGMELKSFQKTTVSGNKVTVDAEIEADGATRVDRITLVKEAGDWKIDGYEWFAVSATIPSDYTTVKVDMQDFAFVFDPAELKPGSVAFEVKNSGEQGHELVFFKVDESIDLEEALAAEGEPEGVEFLGFIAFRAGHASNLVLGEPLEAGRYVMLCFYPDIEDDEGTPHFVKGMVADFNIN